MRMTMLAVALGSMFLMPLHAQQVSLQPTEANPSVAVQQ